MMFCITFEMEITMNKRQDEPSLSLMELWFKVYKNKLLVIIITLVFVALAFVVERVYTHETTMLDTRFEYTFINVENGMFPDKTPFIRTEIISYDHLKEVKDSDSKFNDIDIVSMSTSNDIKILQLVQVTQNSRIIVPGVFTISIKQKYFSDREIARDFIQGLIKNVIVEAKEKNTIFEMSNYLSTVDELEYLDSFNAYQEQYAAILNGLNNIQATYGNLLIDDNQRIGEIINDFQKWWGIANINALKVKFTTTPVIKNEAYLVRLQNQQNLLERDSEFINLHIESLMVQVEAILTHGENIQQIPTLEAKIQQLVSEDQAIQRMIADNQLIINADINNTISAADEMQIEEIETKLLEHLELYNTTYVDLLNRDTYVEFYSGGDNIFETSGGISIFLVAIFGLLGGLVGSFIIVLIKESVITYRKNQAVTTESDNL